MSIANIFGQNVAYYSEHQLPLAWNFPKILICHFDEHCVRKSARCREEKSEGALCESHMKDNNEKVFVVPFAGKNRNELETVYDEDDTPDHNEDRSLDSNDPSTLADVPVDSGIVKI